MKGLMQGTSHYMDIEKKEEMREISNPLKLLASPRGFEPLLPA